MSTRQSQGKPSRRILLVDDHAFVNVGVKSFLEQHDGSEVVGVAQTYTQALQMLDRLEPDIAVVDITIGAADGIELVKQIASRWPRVRTIVLSIHDERTYAERALRAGARGYVMKSEPPEVLVEAIAKIERGGVHLSAELQAEMASRYFRGDDETEVSEVERLTDRELSVFRMLGEGRSSREISEALNVGFKTVQTYRERIKEKLGLASANELVHRAVLHVQEETTWAARREADRSDDSPSTPPAEKKGRGGEG